MAKHWRMKISRLGKNGMHQLNVVALVHLKLTNRKLNVSRILVLKVVDFA